MVAHHSPLYVSHPAENPIWECGDGEDGWENQGGG